MSAIVNDMTLLGGNVCTEELPIEEAKNRGAIALFGEKYGDTVRVVSMADGFSVEFCGGTHLDNTAKVGVFHIDSEFSVASGVRRIEASTGKASLALINRNQELLAQTAAALKAKPAEVREKAEATMGEMKKLRQQVEQYKARETAGEAERLFSGAREVRGLKVITATVSGADAAKLRSMAEGLWDRGAGVVAVLACVNEEKINLAAACGPEAVGKGVKAGDLIRQVCAACGGKGGGKPDMAMGGGSDVTKLDEALARVDALVNEIVQ